MCVFCTLVSRYLEQDLGLCVVKTKTGVKHLHKAALAFEVSAYFEANGHGTVLFQDSFLASLRALVQGPAEADGRAAAAAASASHLLELARLVNPAIGDALSIALLVYTILVQVSSRARPRLSPRFTPPLSIDMSTTNALMLTCLHRCVFVCVWCGVCVLCCVVCVCVWVCVCVLVVRFGFGKEKMDASRLVRDVQGRAVADAQVCGAGPVAGEVRGGHSRAAAGTTRGPAGLFKPPPSPSPSLFRFVAFLFHRESRTKHVRI